MAEATVTPAAVQRIRGTNNDTVTKDVFAGATIVAGQWVYLDTANSNVAKLAQNDGTALEATVEGMALNGAASGQPLQIAIGGPVTMDGLTAKKFYFASSTAGAMELESDNASTERIVNLGYATAATTFVINIQRTGLTVT